MQDLRHPHQETYIYASGAHALHCSACDKHRAIVSATTDTASEREECNDYERDLSPAEDVGKLAKQGLDRSAG